MVSALDYVKRKEKWSKCHFFTSLSVFNQIYRIQAKQINEHIKATCLSQIEMTT